MIFYRLQSNNYEINEKHISFNCNFSSIEEAMEADLLDSNLITLNELNIQKENKSIREIWTFYKKTQSNLLYGWVEPGICCYREPKDLYNYFENYFTEDNNTDYILIFDGEFIDFGSEGEDCAKFIKEINRISIKKFKEMYL